MTPKERENVRARLKAAEKISNEAGAKIKHAEEAAALSEKGRQVLADSLAKADATIIRLTHEALEHRREREQLKEILAKAKDDTLKAQKELDSANVLYTTLREHCNITEQQLEKATKKIAAMTEDGDNKTLRRRLQERGEELDKANKENHILKANLNNLFEQFKAIKADRDYIARKYGVLSPKETYLHLAEEKVEQDQLPQHQDKIEDAWWQLSEQDRVELTSKGYSQEGKNA